jgi:hypothetical protein
LKKDIRYKNATEAEITAKVNEELAKKLDKLRQILKFWLK